MSRSFLGASYEQTKQRFLRGAIDQCIEEHVRKCSPGDCAAFSKIAVLAGLATGTGARGRELRREHSEAASDNNDAAANDPLAKEEAVLKYKKFMAQFSREECTFTTWVNSVKGFESSAANAQFKWNHTNNENMRLAISQMFDQVFPVQEAPNIEKGDNKARAAHRSAEDYYGTTSSTLKVHLLNGTYCGAVNEDLLGMLPRHVSATVNREPESTVYVILSFLRGYGISTERHAPRLTMQKVIKSLTEDPDLNLEVNTFTLCFEKRPTGGWAGGPMRLEGALCFSADRTKTMDFACRFSKSALYRNETTGALCKAHPRSSYVCPTNPAVQGYHFPDTSLEKMDKQRYTGPGMYWPLVLSLLSGLGLKSKDLVHFREEVAYDGTLASTLLEMMAAPPEQFVVPKFSCSMLLWMGSASSIRNNLVYLDKTLTNFVKSLIKKGFRVNGYDPLPPLDMHATSPGPLDLSLFKVTMPITSTMTMQIREDEWLAVTGHPEVKSQADKWLDHFNARHNPSGNFWVDSKKRPADFAAEGDEAVTLPKLSPEDPETIEELEKGAAGQGLKKGLSTLQTGLLVAKTTEGAVYLYAEDADMVARKDTPLYGWGPGKWLVDKELKAAEDKTASAPTLVPFMCNDTQEEIRFYGKPPFTDAAFSSSPQPLRQFLQYLEKTHNVTEHTLVNHTVERTDGGANSNPDYIVKQVLPCKFLPSSKDDKNWCVAVTYAKIAASERVRAMVDIECQQQNTMCPGDIHLFLKQDTRIYKNKLTRIV
ncbi:unnamed protein product [Prorocentrum cordatum]|uniref:Uncharacterized protein n=1 Tax=Prorocentrum cordatum TaxID=2364126 RepID=A0ABN9SP70_9DINO|nr:unnamed protein product [Polarella glacialis]